MPRPIKLKPQLLLLPVLFLLVVSAAFIYRNYIVFTPKEYPSPIPIIFPFVTDNSVMGSTDKAINIATPPVKVALPGATWVPQTFNNCGPATTSMVLQYFGINVDQNTIKAAIRTNPDDKNVFTYEVAAYLKNQHGIDSKLLYNGDLTRLKTLIANGFYVVVEDFLRPNEDIGHFVILRGYDDEKGVFIADDSYFGVNITYKYDTFDTSLWKPFNREYLPVFKPEQLPLLEAIIGDDADETKMYQRSIIANQEAVRLNPRDVYSHFNLGTSYFALGDYQKAKSSFEEAKRLGWPKRMLWYQIQPIETNNYLGDYDQALTLANEALVGYPTFSEVHLQKAIAYKGLGDLVKAKQEVELALRYSPNLAEAIRFLNSL